MSTATEIKKKHQLWKAKCAEIKRRRRGIGPKQEEEIFALRDILQEYKGAVKLLATDGYSYHFEIAGTWELLIVREESRLIVGYYWVAEKAKELGEVFEDYQNMKLSMDLKREVERYVSRGYVSRFGAFPESLKIVLDTEFFPDKGAPPC